LASHAGPGPGQGYQSFARPGGIMQTGLMGFIAGFIGYGPGRVEDIVAMAGEHPVMDAYWEDRVARLDRIDVPAYVTAGWNTALHSRGSIDGFRRIASAHKWLVAHREFESPYFYTPENLEDLRRFFDRYLKGIRNGWELTPRVRIDVMDADDSDHASKRPEAEFPLARTQYRELFLDAAARSLSRAPAAQESFAGYQAETGQVAFEMTFDQQTELTGFMKLRLWVQARGADDMDLIVTVQKADADGNVVPTLSAAGPRPLRRAADRERADGADMMSGAAEEHFCVILGALGGSCIIVRGAAMTNSMPPSLA
jgi:hypothetical protein